jgi:predicted RNase H-like nuclease (RuvC/YqgF family)
MSLLANRYVIGFLLIASVLSTAGVYYYRTSAKIERLSKENAELTILVHSQEKAIELLIKESEAVRQRLLTFQLAERKAGEKIKELEDKLNRKARGKKSLGELALKKSSLIEKKANLATKEVFKCFKDISKGKDCS